MSGIIAAMETAGGADQKPWEGPEYDWVDVHAADPQIAAKKIMDILAAKNAHFRLPNAREVRDDLLANYHTPPPGVDLDRADHFLRALGINARPTIIFDSGFPKEQFSALLEETGIQLHRGAQFSDEIDASIIYPPQLPIGYTIDEAKVHEGVHSVATMPGQVWNEGLACLIQEIYNELCGNTRKYASISAPYSPHDIGVITLGNLCEHDPSIFKKMLDITHGESVYTHKRFLAAMYLSMGGSRPFWYLASECGPGTRHTSLPPGLRKVIDDKEHVPLGSVLEIVKDRLAKYEAETGYSFNFLHKAAHLGAAALAQEATPPTGHDPIAVQLNRLAKGFSPAGT